MTPGQKRTPRKQTNQHELKGSIFPRPCEELSGGEDAFRRDMAIILL
jgi:hypothetical protein